jgi:hypothetical protein
MSGRGADVHPGIQGQLRDQARLRRQWDRWHEDLAAQAEGWLGPRPGWPPGRFIAVARFASEEAARRNSDRAEQGRWWAETADCFAGEATFHDCPEVDVFLGGDSDEAGFVQVIQGQAVDVERLRAGAGQFETLLRTLRPDVIGGTVAWQGDEGFTQTVYFTSEAEGRAGERREAREELRGVLEEWQRLIIDPRYFDLPDPWLSSP